MLIENLGKDGISPVVTDGKTELKGMKSLVCRDATGFGTSVQSLSRV